MHKDRALVRLDLIILNYAAEDGAKHMATTKRTAPLHQTISRRKSPL